jgi:hypothetical protein
MERLCRTVDRINPARVCGSYREGHLRRILLAYARYYNDIRTHRSLDKDAPALRPIQWIGDIASPDPRRTSSPLRPGVEFSVHTRAQIGRSANLRFRRQAHVGHAFMVRTLAIDYGLQERRPSRAIP